MVRLDDGIFEIEFCERDLSWWVASVVRFVKVIRHDEYEWADFDVCWEERERRNEFLHAKPKLRLSTIGKILAAPLQLTVLQETVFHDSGDCPFHVFLLLGQFTLLPLDDIQGNSLRCVLGRHDDNFCWLRFGLHFVCFLLVGRQSLYQ